MVLHAVLGAGALALAACGALPAPDDPSATGGQGRATADEPHVGRTAAPTTEPGLDGEWRLQTGRVDGDMIEIPLGQPIWLTIDGTTATGRSSCNAYGASVLLDGATIAFRRIEATAMGCLAPAMTAETAYYDALGRVRTAAREGDRLTLTGQGVELRFERSPAGS